MHKTTLIVLWVIAIIFFFIGRVIPTKNTIWALVDERLAIHAQIVELQKQEEKIQKNICSKEASLCQWVSTGAIQDTGVVVSATPIEQVDDFIKNR